MKISALLALASLAAVLPAFAQTPPTPPAAPAAPGHVVPLTSIVPDGKPHTIELKNKHFNIDGQPTLLIAGELHFGRTLPDDFELRVKQAKAMGLNTLSFYLFWNLVETEEGKFDFSGMNDVRRMLKACQDNGMWAILRPGPYCCAEIEYGGIPYWTLKYPDVKIRTNDPKYMAWCKNYIERVYKEVADFEIQKGGPLLMVQVENEYGIIAAGNYDHPRDLSPLFKAAGFSVPLFVCDPSSLSPKTPGPNPYGENILRGRNGLNGEAGYQQHANAIGDFPVFSPEVYTAWFSGWGQPITTRNAAIPAVVNWTNFLLDHDASWCYYVFFGGSNYAFTTGCNEWLPLQTSYDYSAPIDEAGRVTEKYKALRDLLARRTGRTLPPIPADPAVSTLPTITFTEHQPLTEWLPAKPTLTSKKPVAMEDLNQDYGFVLYRKTFPAGIKGTLELKQAMDYTITMVNGKTVGKSFVGFGPASNKIILNESGPTTLDLLVHNLGRISVVTSSNTQSRAHKGLIGGAFLDGNELADFDIYSLPMKTIDNLKPSPTPPTGPAFYHATFTVATPISTFLDMSNFSFGAVWVNGHNLGRHWDQGGLRSLFLPAAFLKPGTNDITVLELHDAPKTAEIKSSTKIVEGPVKPFALRLDRAVPAP